MEKKEQICNNFYKMPMKKQIKINIYLQINCKYVYMAFWGDRDTSIFFYEEPYVKCDYIAEYYNSLSGFIYAIVGIYFLRTKIYKMGQTLIVLGIGTIALHSTQRWYGQWLDELSMLYLSFQSIQYLRLHEKKTTSLIWIPLGLSIYIQSYNFLFILLFAVCQIYILFVLKKPIPKKNYEIHAYIYNIIYKYVFLLSSIIWTIEHYGYDSTDSYHLHAWWHIGTGVSVFFGLNELVICI